MTHAGKTLALVADVGPTGLVVACDVRPRRLRLLRQTLATAAAHRARIVQVPLSGPLPFAPLFDAVLVDAPCSGLGVLNRHVDKLVEVRVDLRALRCKFAAPGAVDRQFKFGAQTTRGIVDGLEQRADGNAVAAA